MGNAKINDKYWMSIAVEVATASTCRVEVGCVIVRNRQMLSQGFVGSISGDQHCTDVGCLLMDNYGLKGSSDYRVSCERTVHAELNGLLRCVERGSEENGWLEAYCTHKPCLICFKALLSIGVRKFVYLHDYKDLYRDAYIDKLDASILMKLEFYRINDAIS